MSRKRIKILDGSYGFQLNKHLEKPLDDDPLWSSRALITNPEAVIKTHMDYIQDNQNNQRHAECTPGILQTLAQLEVKPKYRQLKLRRRKPTQLFVTDLCIDLTYENINKWIGIFVYFGKELFVAITTVFAIMFRIYLSIYIRVAFERLKAGVDIIETNTYQASVMGFMKYLGISREESIKVIEKAVDLAKTAILKCEAMGIKPPLIAGSVGPYGAYLHDGSEYTGSYMEVVTEKELREYHEPRIDALVQAGVDLLAIETIPSKREASILIDIVKKYPEMKVWVSFSCKMDGVSTAYGDNYESTAVEIYRSNPNQIIAVGVNCVAPHTIESLLRNINADPDNPIPLIVYANSGENYDPKSGWDNNCEKLEEYIPTWLNLGVKIIGGCCRVTSSYIEKIREEVVKWEEHSSS